MTSTEMHRDDHHGVPVYWSDIRVTYVGVLTFAVGVRNETPLTAGVTHLVEHLVMSQVGKVSVKHNASTEEDRISFFAQGPADLVADFLNRVAKAIRELHVVTDAVVAEQRNVISTEMGQGDELTGGGPLLARFGARGLGLLDLGAPAHRSLSRDLALRWSDAWLHAANATLTLSGPAPDGLDVRLPLAREMPARAVTEMRGLAPHGWTAGGSAPLVISMVIESRDVIVSHMALRVIDRVFMDELRTKRQLIYGVGALSARIDEHTVFCAYALDPMNHHITAAATAAVESLRALAAAGPLEETLSALHEEALHEANDADAQVAHLVEVGLRYLIYGIEPRSIRDTDLSSASADDIKNTIARGLESLLVSMGELDGSATEDNVTQALGLPYARFPAPHYESANTRSGRAALMFGKSTVFRSKLLGGQRGQGLVIDQERIALTVPKWGVVEVRWDELVLAGVCSDCGHWDLTDHHGRGLIVEPLRWRGHSKILQLLMARVPVDIRYTVRHPS